MRTLAIALFLVSGLSVVAARADEQALVTYKSMTPETALRLAQAALKDCRAKGYQVAVAVVDRSGVTQVLIRDRFAGPHTPETARRKAWTVVSFRSDTRDMVDVTSAGQKASGVRFVAEAMIVSGGVMVQAAGSLVGAIGVSGAPSGELDDGCARAGVAAVQEDLDF
jgi:uncharacterized protein GlcG (DUF336 family)